MSGTAKLLCQHCGQLHQYQAPDVHVALIPGGVDDSVQLMWFTCRMCGDFNSQTVSENFAMMLTDAGAVTTVVGPIPELDEDIRARVDPIPGSVVQMVEAMSLASFNAVVHKRWLGG